MTVLVTGATGRAGRHVVDQLLLRGASVRALTRDPAAARLPAAVEVVGGDLDRPTTLEGLFDGIEAMHLITVGAGYATLRTGPRIVELAEQAGVRRATVLWNGEPGPVEAAIAASSLERTCLEATDFMSNALVWAPEIAAGEAVREAFADVRVAIVDEADVGAVAATLLTDPAAMAAAGERLTLTGPQPLSVRERVAAIGAQLGRALPFEQLSEAQARERWRAAGTGEELIDLLVAWHSGPPPAATTPGDGVERVLGRPAGSFARWAAAHADAFGAPAGSDLDASLRAT